MMKVARLAELTRRLRTVLDESPELAQAFQRAFERHDEQALGEAFQALHQSPPEVRRNAEAAIVEWLFGADGNVDAANVVSEPSSTQH